MPENMKLLLQILMRVLCNSIQRWPHQCQWKWPSIPSPLHWRLYLRWPQSLFHPSLLTQVTVHIFESFCLVCFLLQNISRNKRKVLISASYFLKKPAFLSRCWLFSKKESIWATDVESHVCLYPPDGLEFGDNYPSQAEMALVYQSAAWILAGLLLAIIIFLFVAFFINKKKKWVQMSCYSAPKKVTDTVKWKKKCLFCIFC